MMTKKGFGFSTIMYGVLIILFIYSSFKYVKNTNLAFGEGIGDEGYELLKLVYTTNSYHNFLYNQMELDINDNINTYFYPNNYSILKSNFSNFIEELFSNSFEKNKLNKVTQSNKHYHTKNYNELSFKTNFDYENPYLMKANYFSEQKVSYSTIEEYDDVIVNSFCDIKNVEEINFNQYSGCEKIFNELYSRTQDTKLSLFITAMSFLDTKCNKKNPFFIPVSYDGPNRVDSKMNFENSIDYILDLFQNNFEELTIDENYYLFSYIHNRGGLLEIKRQIESGSSYYEVIENHCYSHYKDNWDNYFEENPTAQTTYKFIQEDFICNGPKMGLNYPSEIFSIYDLMCEDSNNEIKKETEKRTFSVANYKTNFLYNYDLEDTIINFLFNISTLDYSNCKNSNQNITKCVYDSINLNLRRFNNRLNNYYDNEYIDENKLQLNNINFASALKVSDYQKRIQNALNLISDFKELNLSNMPECKILDYNENIGFDNKDIIYDNYLLPTNFSFSQDSLNGKNLILRKTSSGYNLQLIAEDDGVYPDCKEVYNFDNDAYYIPFSISNELKNKSLFVENNFSDEIELSQTLGMSFSNEDMVESFKFDFGQIENQIENLKNLELIISKNNLGEGGLKIDAKTYYVYEKDENFEIFDYNFTKKLNMTFPVNGTEIYFKTFANDWFGNQKQISNQHFTFIDETAFDFAIPKGFNKQFDFYYKNTNENNFLDLNWEKNLRFYNNDKYVDKDYFDSQLAFYNIYYIEKSKELYKEFQAMDFIDLDIFTYAGKTNETSFRLDGLEKNQEYYVAIAQVDKSGNIPVIN